jgi:hypothetical protein
LGLDKKVNKKQPAEVVLANNKEVPSQPTEQEKKLAELKVKEEEITSATLKQLTDYMDLKGQTMIFLLTLNTLSFKVK